MNQDDDDDDNDRINAVIAYCAGNDSSVLGKPMSESVFSTRRAHIRHLKSLLRLGADVNAQSHEGETALANAVNDQDEAAVRLLLHFNADASILNRVSGDSLLHVTARVGACDIIWELLIQHGADLFVLNRDHRQPLELLRDTVWAARLMSSLTALLATIAARPKHKKQRIEP
uniref:Uncharacterized protein n=1 Tax=Globisporangium ultimum (strain ATCC 200006 / CBS 805.95 / DAOM BR144) TaxID=431595 RepID=K3WW20_GLOUD